MKYGYMYLLRQRKFWFYEFSKNVGAILGLQA